MHRLLKVSPILAMSVLIAACGSSSNSSKPSSTAGGQSGSSASAAVKTTSNATLGTILVNSQGMTLYRLSGERNGRFICTSSACLGVWHPLTVPSGSMPSGQVGSLSTVKRPDGTTQVTYKGQPLYTFAQDQHSGEVNGQGFKDVGTWNAVTAGAAASSSSSPKAAAPAASSGGGSSGGYGY